MGLQRFHWATREDTAGVEAQPLESHYTPGSVYTMLAETAARVPDRKAISFQLKGGASDPAETYSWADLHREVCRTANLLRSIGIGEGDTVAYVLPNSNETVMTLLAGMTAGIVMPINPLLETGKIASILREVGAKAVVTLAPFPKTDIAQKIDAALEEAPSVTTLIEVDLNRYLSPPLSWIIPFLRPKLKRRHRAKVVNFRKAIATQNAALTFRVNEDPQRIAATFHSGGTTGSPKVARHAQGGQVYNGRIPVMGLFTEEDVFICPLPLFHVLAAYPLTMSVIAAGAHMVMPTPAGFRGDGVMDNFWALIERYGVTFLPMVPTAASALMQRPIKHDVSSLKYALCGSAPLPTELFRRFESATGVKILEGYGMTEATCLVSINPPMGERKIGSVGLPIPYTDVKILQCGPEGEILRECGTDEVGEICIASPGVFPGYVEEALNRSIFAGASHHPGHGYLRTGDLGRLDEDGYLWITGRAKDLIIRGGHNIDPGLIEEAICKNPAIAFAGAIGQPDAHAGEVPAVYVELSEGAVTTDAEILAFAKEHIHERAAVPKHVEIMAELPKTAVGKVFKPDLRKMAIARVYGAALAEMNIEAGVTVVDDKKLGLVAELTPADPDIDDAAIDAVLGDFARPWRRAVTGTS